ncbi:GNAT family N-acetyltransferase [Clostridium sporogenes]|uniref:GNAT family N-acetyltransferase n=1 Tax=Clostridium sporogenes TaxID=1509 RepID=UPI0013D27FD8|nr:GNAT family N-acetyltransferase [Clostridium sporogenes]NFF65898.1 GNAT family N-acetyltransferase [Clostridium sporogenes]NFF98287.1 GNAT family N-acetyltransferase [Clostridium sporogenes]NFG05365.1 GNAT family N-acetyltransferase [Clostridium sporogenes]NFG50964.1 GNAT family N-acetyltransferase [Clostridium sporogenes]NFP83204.1 GNAT family N-acetyltransferase [Clostridium sporogenes]
MLEYRTLNKTSIETLHKAFLDAFSDYQIEVDLSIDRLKQMLQRRGYVPEISIGAFKNDLLVGFILNGLRSWNGKTTVYDIGTGVIIDYRRQGITSSMLLNVKEILKQKQVEQYLLEVIQSNTSAFQFYKKEGFQIKRNFPCFELDKKRYVPLKKYKVEHTNRMAWEQLTEFWDFEPSWQNSMDSINAVSEEFLYSIVHFDNTIVGYGIINKKTGDIPQIAVNKHYRGKGIGRSIITDLMENTESHKISVINVDDESKCTKDFLIKLGFEYIVGQYEMLLKI